MGSHKYMGILRNTLMYTHKHCLSICVVFAHTSVYVCICNYGNYLMFYISYNATSTANAVAQLFPYRDWGTCITPYTGRQSYR